MYDQKNFYDQIRTEICETLSSFDQFTEVTRNEPKYCNTTTESGSQVNQFKLTSLKEQPVERHPELWNVRILVAEESDWKLWSLKFGSWKIRSENFERTIFSKCLAEKWLSKSRSLKISLKLRFGQTVHSQTSARRKFENFFARCHLNCNDMILHRI